MSLRPVLAVNGPVWILLNWSVLFATYLQWPIFSLLQLLLIDLLADVSLHITVKQNDSFYGYIV